jgi:hypothetical protein
MRVAASADAGAARARKRRRAYAPRAHCKISGDAFSLIHARRSSAMSLSCAPPAPADGASSYAASPMRTKRQAQAAPRCTPTVARGLPRVACAPASRRLDRWSGGRLGRWAEWLARFPRGATLRGLSGAGRLARRRSLDFRPGRGGRFASEVRRASALLRGACAGGAAAARVLEQSPTP